MNSGTRLILRTLDDRYQPNATVQNFRQLVDSENVFLLISCFGAQGILNSLSYYADIDTVAQFPPLVGSMSGVSSLRFPFHRKVLNVRPSFEDEAVALLLSVRNHWLRLPQSDGSAVFEYVSCFYQNDAVCCQCSLLLVIRFCLAHYFHSLFGV